MDYIDIAQIVEECTRAEALQRLKASVAENEQQVTDPERGLVVCLDCEAPIPLERLAANPEPYAASIASWSTTASSSTKPGCIPVSMTGIRDAFDAPYRSTGGCLVVAEPANARPDSQFAVRRSLGHGSVDLQGIGIFGARAGTAVSHMHRVFGHKCFT